MLYYGYNRQIKEESKKQLWRVKQYSFTGQVFYDKIITTNPVSDIDSEDLSKRRQHTYGVSLFTVQTLNDRIFLRP